jgi:hypothetical protein
LDKKLKKVAPGDLEGMFGLLGKEMSQGPRGLDATMKFYMKLGSALEKMAAACGRS